ncbi:MAG: topoisomerase [Conexibacter sp.]|nr:topoisomerase [Conexibacter sp.]
MSEIELVHVHGGEPGLRRRRRGRRLVYVDDATSEPVTDHDTIARIEALHIPPAWTDVWISARPDTHLQATGLDAKGRRQYLYHPEWRQRRDAEKFDDMLDFAAALPTLRRAAQQELGTDGAPREHALALAIRLLDVGLFRVGWDRYARDNGHVGLTTLRREQVTLLEDAVQFDYVGKHGKRRRMTVRDPDAVVAIAPLRRRRGEPLELLAYRTNRAWHRVTASDVNNALRSWADGPYSAKEFRTWAGTVLAAAALARAHASGQAATKRAVNQAVRQVSTALGNTPAVARAAYIDPRVIDSYENGMVIELPAGTPEAAMPLRIETGEDGVVIELPTDATGHPLREDVERRVRSLLRS